ncbi:MAG TPA: hypothetical protein PLE19_13855 [Planctomycetota bacterium]|nr:hypothetical protein [Planctomycetota bacterium]HRR79532.1 hypothetical protein [Planctomycetota bacterium]HRT96140.1 hypothetical protein [Planctomycetota bacterium]
MYLNKTLGFSLLAIALVFAWSSALAAPSVLSTDYRYAAQADRTFTRGGGTVAESKLLPRGLRFAAPEAQDGQARPVATAIYLFKVPLAATALTIEVAYRVDAAARDKDVAGLLFVRNEAMEKAAAEADQLPKSLESEPAFFGNLYFLRGSETTMSFTLPFEDHVVDGVLEVHLSAGPGQAYDAQYVQVTAQRSAGGYAPTQVQGGRSNDPLNYTQQPERVFFGNGLPNLYPNIYGAGHATSLDPLFWRQIWMRQYPHSAYQYPYIYFNFHDHKEHKDKK